MTDLRSRQGAPRHNESRPNTDESRARILARQMLQGANITPSALAEMLPEGIGNASSTDEKRRRQRNDCARKALLALVDLGEAETERVDGVTWYRASGADLARESA